MQLSFIPKRQRRIKKIKIAVVIVILSLIAIQVSAVLLNNLYFEKLAIREAKRISMSHHDANAIKHAYAASLVYSSLRMVWFSKEMAQESTILLGKLNEISETIFKPNRDSSLEMMKDMANNMMGICVAQWLENNAQSFKKNRLSIIRNMAKKEVLILSREDLMLDWVRKKEAKKSFEYAMAGKWFDINEKKFTKRAKEFLKEY